MSSKQAGRRRTLAVAIGNDGAVLRQLRTLFNVGTIRELTDGQLLERFATDRSEAAEFAFAVLVERHGPMVLRVCRGVLADPNDTQDAFQATFLVLVKKARALWVRDSLGPWLHQVAFRTASCARATAARRRRHEQRAAEAARQSRPEPAEELGRVLHEEIDRLPERYRAPVVLCDLEGCTHEEAARHLGWPIGTVKSRQSRARERLRDRLSRRGLAPSAGVLETALRPEGASASISPALVDATTRAVVRFVTVSAVVPGSATSLAREVLRSMAISGSWKVASVLLALGVAASGVTVLATQATPPAEQRAEGALKTSRADEQASFTVKPGKLRVTTTGRGSVQASHSEDAFCQVEGTTTIIKLVPEGTRVQKGQLVCELDSAGLKDQLINQLIAVKAAENALERAKLAREIAQMAASEYLEGTYKQEHDTLKGAIVTTQSAIQKAEARRQRTQRARKRMSEVLAPKADALTPAEIVAELDVEDRLEATEQTLSTERLALELGQSKLAQLEKFTRDKKVKTLQLDVARAEVEERASTAGLSLERQRVEKLKREIASCNLYAPSDGVVVYANDPNRFGGANLPQIEEGAEVRERQKIFSLPDLNAPMQVNSKVPEAWVDQVAQGQPARIK
ncbi:MAG TPA: sigma-70 family RNA polymerase sigma factor, partial [Isosphaeraceae bacterium]|nr:sigma-70 family RNA polymerase sigma factor [Isosphaeraceae bacterium]